MFDSSPREMLEIAAEKYGQRRANALFHLCVLAFVCTAIGIVGALVIAAQTYVIAPAMKYVPDFNVGTSYQDAVLSFGLTVLLLAISGSVVFWRFTKWQRALYRSIERYVTEQHEGFEKRIANLEFLVIGIPQLLDKVKKQEDMGS